MQRKKTMILRNTCFRLLQHDIQNIRNTKLEFPQKSHRNAWHELTISDQRVIIIGSMCERLMPGNNSVPKLFKKKPVNRLYLCSFRVQRGENWTAKKATFTSGCNKVCVCVWVSCFWPWFKRWCGWRWRLRAEVTSAQTQWHCCDVLGAAAAAAAAAGWTQHNVTV